MQIRALDALVAELAERQHGVIARGQLLNRGIAGNAVDNRVRLGRLHRLHPGVYAVGHRMLTREGRWMGAVLAGGEGAVLSHRSAAALWSLRTTARGIEITTRRSTRSRGSIQRHCANLPADEVTVRRGIPVTTVPRTLFDLAAVLPPDGLKRPIREAEVLQLRDRLSLPALLARYPGHRGNRALRFCLRLGQTVDFTRSELEDRFVEFLRKLALPRPDLNAWLEIDGRWVQADCLWRRHGLIVELDGHAVHGTRSAFEGDRDRDRRLQAAGWRVVRVTWRQLHDEGDAVGRDLRELLERR